MIIEFIKHLLFPEKKYIKKNLDKQTLLLEEMDTYIESIQNQRPHHKHFINGELAWVLYERHALLWEINKRRIKDGKSPIEIDKLLKSENCAVGHIDYSHKLALYSRDLINEE